MAYEAFVETVVKSVVENPDAIEIEEESEGNARTFYINCDPEDVGKVIGKQGRVAKAIRTVVNAAASQQGKKVYVKIQE